MTRETRVTMHPGAAAFVAVTLLVVGVGGTYLWMRRDSGAGGRMADIASPAGAQPPPSAPAGANSGPLPDVVVPLSQEAVERAGIVVAPVARGYGVYGNALCPASSNRTPIDRWW